MNDRNEFAEIRRVLPCSELCIKKDIIKKIRFTQTEKTDFSVLLKQRVADYFKSNNIKKKGDSKLLFKTIIMFALFFVPLALLSIGVIGSAWMVFLMYFTSGVGMVGIGMGIMHDANHGSYSSNSKLNDYLSLSLNLVGANSKIWKIQHNVLHHTYTNVEEADEDIDIPILMRLTPNSPRYSIHRFQHIYAWIIYGLSTLFWVTIKDFISLLRYHKMGLHRGSLTVELLKIIFWKAIYYSYALVLPLIFAPVASWIIIVAFLCMHFLIGLFISSVFQVAHVVPTCDFPLVDQGGKIENSWIIHQLETTSNFAPKSRVMSWFIGGLNYQIEHHLFPTISHVHYRNISKIVRDTTREFGVRYTVNGNLIQALRGHAAMLRALGRS